MTLTEIQHSKKDVLTPSDIAEILHCSPYYITVRARQDKRDGTDHFGFPVIVINSRTRIPRIPFLRVMGVDV